MRLLEDLLELIYPTRCAGCDLPGTLVCEACRQAIVRIEREYACPRCGAPFGWLVCTECWDLDLEFEGGICAGVLDRPLSRLVTVYKDGGERRLATVLAALLFEAVAPWLGWPDVVTYVPATAKARRRRGFDHAHDIAFDLAERMGVPCSTLLVRQSAGDQRKLGREGRFTNARGTFSLAGGDLPERVLLIDDVLTTGATLDAAAAALKSGGAREVRVATVARTW